MTDNNYPITPPPELVREWQIKIEYCSRRVDREAFVAKVFQLGADHQLEACCEYLTCCAAWEPEDVEELRDFCRPKPPSLKEQALAVLDDASNRIDAAHENIIRRALEALPE
jgi:hypothetical protein